MSLDAYFRASDKPQTEGLLSRFSDLVLVAGVIAIVALMILPLPALAIDALVAVNMLCGVTLLLLAIYIASPSEFPAFPSVLLVTTLFRLSLGIATTRMILLEGNAGHIIDTFGAMVAGGNLVVGLVTFLIITVVQFIVIAKGAERVAEVAARFSLDAMPGKQMSIDSDLRAGLIDKHEARRKRSALELESKLHGNLDGAMKFVKGDAIAGIVIILINLVGGLAVGVLQRGMDMSSALVKYSILTIGDGLVSQIPALLAAMSAGLIVTRTNGDETDRHLGDSIRKQVMAKPRVLMVAGGISLLMALVPGFPAVVFVVAGLTLLLTGAMLTPELRDRLQRYLRPASQWRKQTEEADAVVVARSAEVVPQPMVMLLLEISGPQARQVDPPDLARRLDAVLRDFNLRLGVALPRVSLHFDPSLPRSSWRLLAFEVPIASGETAPDGVQGIVADCAQALRRQCSLFVGAQEVSQLFTRAAEDLPDLVKDAQRMVPVSRFAEVFRRLVEEEVGVRNLRALLGGIVESADRDTDVHTLTEFARIALRRELCHRHAPGGVLRALLLDPDLENHLKQSVRTAGHSQQLAIDPPFAERLVAAIGAEVARTGTPVLLTTIEVRRHLRKLIENDLFDVAVLSFHELVPTLRMEVTGKIAVPSEPARQIAAEAA
ncbi:MAG: flagellar biosynthesis protein FlhA [Burkholderiales bacterium]